MRWLIDYIRSCFCKHEWELIFYTAIYDRFGSKEIPDHHEKVYRCKKCGLGKRYKSK